MKAIMDKMERQAPDLLQWVKALLSGNYEQCQARLHDGGGFCCIGVYGRSNLKYRARDLKSVGEENSDRRKYIRHTYLAAQGMLNDYGLNSDHYIEANDTGSTFETIAKNIMLDWMFAQMLDDLPVSLKRWYWEDEYHEDGFDLTSKQFTFDKLQKAIDKALNT